MTTDNFRTENRGLPLQLVLVPGGRPGRLGAHQVSAQRPHHPRDVQRAGRSHASSSRPWPTGADGVMIAGCHPGECHYIEQNYKAMRRFSMLKHTLTAMGVEPDRVQLVWASAAEGQRLAECIDQAGRRRPAARPA